METYQARKIIEALRSGISSRDVGQYFTSARPGIMREFQETFDNLGDGSTPHGRIISGKYGEGKTHLLNTLFNMAHQQNIVVSTVTLSKETPLSGLHQIYPKILQGTYLPGQVQPGISQIFEQLSLTNVKTAPLLEYCLTRLELNKLYYVLKAYLGTQDDEEKYLLLGDIEGDFMAPAGIRKIYRRVFGEPATFNGNFVKSKHLMDYFAFLSRLFQAQGYNGWLILFDEAELTGRLGRKSRHSAYLNMSKLLNDERLENTYSVFAFNASYVPDVIEAKHEYEMLETNLKLTPEMLGSIANILDKISSATQLAPLGRDETKEILERIGTYHGIAYEWNPVLSAEQLIDFTEQHGYLLRTRIRSTVEMLDQLYQYGEVGEIHINDLGEITFDEDEDSSLESFV
jgi:hypothetical protein